jgi:short-subunit dehydrogenase
MSIDSSTALITGGTSCIGQSSADKLARVGIHVIVVGRNADVLRREAAITTNRLRQVS